jgi:uncharacterized protein involved in exopolysaccharide biosynthesis
LVEEPGLFLWIRLGLKHFRLVVGAGLLAGILSLGVAFLLPKAYRARASVLPPREEQFSSLPLSGAVAAAGLDLALPFSADVTLLDVYQGILSSDTAARRLAETHDLAGHYHQSTMVRTIKTLRSRTMILARKDGIIEVTVEDRSAEMAAALANDYVRELDRIFRQTRNNAARRQREFLEQRVLECRADLDSLDSALKEFETGSGITALSRDATEATAAASELLSERLALAVQIEMLDNLNVGLAPYRESLLSRLAAMDEEIAKLPEMGLELARALRDLYIQEKLYEELSRQLETARLEEVRDTPSVEVLDRAVVPDRHTRPRRGLMAVAGAFLGFSLSFAWVVYRDET